MDLYFDPFRVFTLQICIRYTSAAGERIYMMQSNKKVAFSHFFVSLYPPRLAGAFCFVSGSDYSIGVQASFSTSSALSMEVIRPRRM